LGKSVGRLLELARAAFRAGRHGAARGNRSAGVAR